MSDNQIALGGFQFKREGEKLLLRSPQSAVTTGLDGFLRGANHLLKMDFDLEGSAELDGGFVFRVEGERVRLRLGDYSEYFPAAAVASLFREMTAAWQRPA